MKSPNLRGLAHDALELAAIVLAVLCVRTAVAAPNYVPSGSMEPTLAIGDLILSAKYAYGYSRHSLPFDPGLPGGRWLGRMPERGDVVVFEAPGHPGETWVKRVVGLPGERIMMRGGFLWIDGEQVPVTRDGSGSVEDESGRRTPAARFLEHLPGGCVHPILKQTVSGLLDNTPEFRVPAGHLFMMGDNRDHSWDSRAPLAVGGIGFVPVDNLIGRTGLVLGSWDFPRAGRGVTEWPQSLRLSRFFSRVR